MRNKAEPRLNKAPLQGKQNVRSNNFDHKVAMAVICESETVPAGRQTDERSSACNIDLSGQGIPPWLEQVIAMEVDVALQARE